MVEMSRERPGPGVPPGASLAVDTRVHAAEGAWGGWVDRWVGGSNVRAGSARVPHVAPCGRTRRVGARRGRRAAGGPGRAVPRRGGAMAAGAALARLCGCALGLGGGEPSEQAYSADDSGAKGGLDAVGHGDTGDVCVYVTMLELMSSGGNGGQRDSLRSQVVLRARHRRGVPATMCDGVRRCDPESETGALAAGPGELDARGTFDASTKRMHKSHPAPTFRLPAATRPASMLLLEVSHARAHSVGARAASASVSDAQ